MIDVKKVASLARLSLSPEEESKYQSQLADVFKHFEEVSQIDTKGVEPLVTPTQLEEFWREDVVGNTIGTEEALQNAPEKSGHLFKVPPVV